MAEAFRVSVRELTAFSYFEPDIRPQGDALESMRQGTLAHKACQSNLEAQCEKVIQHVFSLDGDQALLYGRMDAFVDGDVPLIDEIKLGSGLEDQPLPAHRAQALCYAAMTALEKPCAQAAFQVRYVDVQGQTLRVFREQQSKAELLSALEAMLRPWLVVARREAAHRLRRDASLRTLAFPFPAYRKGQRELAVQVYTAIIRKRRLFASLPTGTGKSIAVLYPALKALGEGKTGKILYLTSRGTARQSPLNAAKRLLSSGMQARVSVLTAKEKLCPYQLRCTPEECPRAAGHYLRQSQAIDELLASQTLLWTEETVLTLADKHRLCPFELALALTDLADVALMDLNYAFDPFAQAKRLFQRRHDLTLLIDEAHHTADRVRESLSGTMDGRRLCELRAAYGKRCGRKNGLYRSLTAVIHALRSLPETCGQVPKSLCAAIEDAQAQASAALAAGGGPEALALLRMCLPFLYAADRLDQDYALLIQRQGRETSFTLYCLLPGKEIARITKGLPGTIFFSATLRPLPAMKQLLGGQVEDACFALPSPFPSERLAVVLRRINTRYGQREKTVRQVAEAIAEMALSRPGKYMAFFPSYAYLHLIQTLLEEKGLTLLTQEQTMDDAARETFLDAFVRRPDPCLGLCVMGGLFSEGIDLPGSQLIGVAITGVGLPTPSAKLAALQACYQRCFGDGFGYACRIPAMHKVLQAAGRVIRCETDKGMVLLLDDRFAQEDYRCLLPPEWSPSEEPISQAAARLEEMP